MWWRSETRRKSAPVAYLIPLGSELSVQRTWRSKTLTGPTPLYTGESLKIAGPHRARIVFANGRTEEVQGPSEITAPKTLPENSLDFLAPILRRLPSVLAPKSTDTETSIHITSPVGVTRFLDPVISWIEKPNTLYDVAVVDPADPNAPPRILRGAKPPVKVSALETTMRPTLRADRIFGVLVRESVNQNAIGVARFLTSPEATADQPPSSPADALTEALTAMSKTPYRSGDAWLALSSLPEAWRDSELVLRLRWKLAVELNLPQEIEALSRQLAPE
jgi:hypothetical protein